MLDWIPFTLPRDHPAGEPGNRCSRRGQGGSTRTLTQPAVTGPRGLAAVHALHAADHAKYLANIAAAAFTRIAGVGTSRSCAGRGLPLTSRLGMVYRRYARGMVKSAIQPKSGFPCT
jgi:hypothetical protein